MKGLLIIERIVLESISRSNKSIIDLKNDTGINHEILINILQNLLIRNLVLYNRGIYSLNNESSEAFALVNQPTNVKEETKEIFTSMVNQYFLNSNTKKQSTEDAQSEYFPKDLNVKKVWLDREDEKKLKVLLYNLDLFIQKLQQDSYKRDFKLKDKKILYWGFSNYQDVINQQLQQIS